MTSKFKQQQKNSKPLNVQLFNGGPTQQMSRQTAAQLVQQRIHDGQFETASYLLSQIQKNNKQWLVCDLLALRLLSLQQDWQAGEKLSQRLLRRHPSNSEVLLSCGIFLRENGHAEQASQLFKRAVKLKPDSGDGWRHLGMNLAATGEFEQAENAYRKALSINPKHAETFWLLAHLKSASITEYEQEALRIQFTSADKPDEKIHLAFALAWSFQYRDREQEIYWLQQANSLKKSINQWDIQKYLGEVNVFREMLEDSDLQQPIISRSDAKILFIVGLPRSGSTLLESKIAQHTKQSVALGESSLLFKANQRAASALQNSIEQHQDEDTLLQQYLQGIHDHIYAQLKQYSNSQVFIDKSMNNSPLVGLLLLALPNAHVIHLQRNPLDTALSCYRQLFPYGSEYIYDLEDCIRYFQEHQTIMQHWQKLFPEKVLTVNYEDLVENTEECLQNIAMHCQITLDSTACSEQKPNQVSTTASYQQARQAIQKNSVGNWLAYQELFSPLLEKFPELTVKNKSTL